MDMLSTYLGIMLIGFTCLALGYQVGRIVELRYWGQRVSELEEYILGTGGDNE